MKLRLSISAIAALCAAAWIPAGVAQAQDDDGLSGIEEITVTARKREESLQEVPVAITAFGKEDIRQLDLRQLENVSDLTPGFEFKNQGNQQPGRYNTQLKFRGLTTAQFSPSFATGALFIDGIYVLNGGTSLSLMDIERVEVIKGPQAAYFGRNTFGGAVNLITRDPNAEYWTGEVGVATSDRSNNELSVFVEGPIVTDKFAVSFGARMYDKKGHYTSTDGGRLGNEETVSYNLAAKWMPTESLDIKFRYGYSEDDDGAPAQGFVSGILNDNCTGRTIDSPEGPANPVRYICGAVPDVNSAFLEPGTTIIGGNTILPTGAVANLPGFPGLDEAFADPTTNVAGVPNLTRIGMKRETERLSLAVDYDIGDYSIGFVYGQNEQNMNAIRDFDNNDRINWFSRDPQAMEDQSVELRVSGPQDGRFRWLAGVNAYQQEFTSSGGGGDASTSCFSTSGPLTDDASTCIPGFTLFFPNSLQTTDEADVLGIFAAVDFDISDQITLILEGRYQQDELTKGAGLITPGAPILKDSFDKFLPRLIGRWQPNDDTNLFLSYSVGQIAGDFNTFFINADQRERDQYLAAEPTIAESTPAEELTAFEFGWKQVWLDGRVQTNLAIYSQEWTGIKGRSSVQVNETCRAGDIDNDPACQTSNGIGVGDPKQIPDPAGGGGLIPFINSRNVLLPGDADINGVELESWFRPSDDLTLTVNMSYIDSEYTDYKFNFVSPIAGYSQMAGNGTPRQAKWSGNSTITQRMVVGGMDSYIRGEMIYQGKSFVDESNLAFLDDYTLFNLRAGINGENYLVELFIKNLFDEDAWATGARWSDFSSPTQFAFLTAKQGVVVSPQDRREFGIRATYRFGSD
ncbi:MAG: TonB-dependent receptor [Gammaproteobacteria bacterium]|nr:TonB-dependent receptor [Gammaproteobacteria bacterium]